MAHVAITKSLLCGLSLSFEVQGIWHRPITIWKSSQFDAILLQGKPIPTWKISNLHVDIFPFPRGRDPFPPKFHLIPPKFHLIPPRNFFFPTWAFQNIHVDIQMSVVFDYKVSPEFCKS